MINLSTISDSTVKALGLAGLILVTPENTGYQPQNPNSDDGKVSQQPVGLLFQYEGEQSVQLQSDITDHYSEDNKALQNQIALRPVVYTTHGFIGELTNTPPAVLKSLKEASEKISVVSAYVPVISETAVIAYNTAFAAYQLAANISRNAVAAWNTISGNEGTPLNQNKQQNMFQQFFGYWQNRTLFTVQTPWALFKNMAIQNLRAVQNEETNMISDFEITWKQMRFAETLTSLDFSRGVNQSTYNTNNMSGRTYNQGAPQVDLGVSAPEADGATLGTTILA